VRSPVDCNEVHLWRASTQLPRATASGLEACLSNDERAKAGRYRRDADRVRYLASHAMLRLVLSRYVGVGPGSLRFSAGAQGKPKLERDSNSPIFFNLSHSGNLALLAISGDRAVGVDIEEIKNDVDVPALALAVLSESELRMLHDAPTGAQRGLFFGFWVRKEAVLKACGLGLTVEPQRVEIAENVSLGDGSAVAVLPDGKPTNWAVREVEVGDRYAAAVAAPGKAWLLRCFEHRWSKFSRAPAHPGQESHS
jgi:4'-phosphopantetheinyl transferase